MSEENVFDNIQGVTYHFSKDGLLEDWREEVLRHREEIEKLKEQNKMLKEAVKSIVTKEQFSQMEYRIGE